jgi:TRAP-type uncharacterized transport system fused permease subunit
VFTKIAVPEMRRHGYTDRFAVGVVAGSSVLGMLIPPSLLLILFGLLTEQSIGDLFVAGIGPGILLAFFFGAGIIAMAYFTPKFIGENLSEDSVPLTSAELMSKGLPITVLIGVVLGGIYGGFLVGTERLGFNAAAYLQNTVDFLEPRDIISSLAKGAVFGFIAALMGCYYGMNSERGAMGVGRATKSSVVAAAILILAANFVLTGVFFSI